MQIHGPHCGYVAVLSSPQRSPSHTAPQLFASVSSLCLRSRWLLSSVPTQLHIFYREFLIFSDCPAGRRRPQVSLSALRRSLANECATLGMSQECLTTLTDCLCFLRFFFTLRFGPRRRCRGPGNCSASLPENPKKVKDTHPKPQRGGEGRDGEKGRLEGDN